MSSAPRGLQPLGVGGSWRLVFHDEFARRLSTSTWDKCYWWAESTCTNDGNSELELYDSPDVYTENGMLIMRARKRTMVGWDGRRWAYTSGMVSSGGKAETKAPGFNLTYGYLEARVKLPSGQGLWPGFWLLPQAYTFPPEIDVFEVLGHTPSTAHFHLHWAGPEGDDKEAGGTWTGPDFSAGFHVFGVDWEPNSLVWYVDGVERFRLSSTNVPRQRMYVLLNLAVGGTWPGAPDETTVFPAYFAVDYVRVWKRT